MKTQNTSMTDETRVQSVPEAEVLDNKSPKTDKVIWQSVLLGGIPGILVGSVGTIAATEAFATHPSDDSIIDDEPVEVQVAHSVTDDMTFNEAFSAARAEVGPGGAFVWHGGVYGTYRADDPEWLGMTPDQRVEHSQLILSQVHGTPYTPVDHSQTNINNDDVIGGGLSAEQGETDIHIVTVGMQVGGSHMAGVGHIDGHDAILVDSNDDGRVDSVSVDSNDNGVIEADESYEDGPGIGMSVEQMMNEAGGNSAMTLDDHLLSGMPDYVNDADINDLV